MIAHHEVDVGDSGYGRRSVIAFFSRSAGAETKVWVVEA